MSGVGYTDSNAPAPAPPATNYASISTSPSHPQGQNGTRNGYAPAGSNEEPAPWVRFFRALGGAVLVALLAGLLIESIYLATERRAWEKVHLPEGYDVPEGMSVYGCATGAKWNDMSPPDDVQGFQFQEEAVYPVPGYPGPRRPFPPRVYPYSANTTFEVPLGSGDDDDDSFLSFVSRGRWLSGNVNIIASFGQEKGKANVEVVIRHLRHSTQHQVRACVIEKDGGGKGVGLFTPEYEWHWRGDARKRQVDYEINVYLPLRPHESVFIDRLTVDTPYAFVQLPNGPPMMGSSIRFGEVIVNGKNGGIHAGQVLNADRIYVNASDTVVTGNFHVKQALHVETTNANILAMVLAQHSAGSEYGPSVHLQTSNAAMEAQINLLPYTLLPSAPPHVPEYGITPHYEIFAETSNSRLNVNIASGFVGDKIPTPTLNLNATTSNGSVSATLLHEYSGGYDLESVDFGTARLNLRCTKPVPIACSDGVTRDYPEITSKSHLKGALEWVPVKSIPGPGHGHRIEKEEGLKEKKSSVVLTAQNGNVMLTV